jgi:hypothetical protein
MSDDFEREFSKFISAALEGAGQTIDAAIMQSEDGRLTAEGLRRAMTLPDDYRPFQHLVQPRFSVLIPYSCYGAWLDRRRNRHRTC